MDDWEGMTLWPPLA